MALVALEETLGLKLAGSWWLGVEWGGISSLEVVMRPPSVFVQAVAA